MHDNLIGAYKAMQEMTGTATECKLISPAFDLWDAYTTAVSRLVGDKDEWLQWFELDCDFGKSPKVCTFASGKTLKVKTLKQLARVIADK